MPAEGACVERRGDALRSGLHGALWATAYVAPLGAVIAIAHALLASR